MAFSSSKYFLWLFSFCLLCLSLSLQTLQLQSSDDEPHHAQVPAPIEKLPNTLSLQVFWDGSVAAQDTVTGEMQWSFSSGPPLSSSHGLFFDTNATSGILGPADISDDKYVFCGTDWKLDLYDKRNGIDALPLSPDELVRSTPAVLDGAIVLGSVSTSAFLVDANSGILLRTFDSRNTSPIADSEQEENMERLLHPTMKESKDADFLFILRKDYSLRSVAVGSGAVLWNVSVGEVQLHYVQSDAIPSLPQLEGTLTTGAAIQRVESTVKVKTLEAVPARIIATPRISEPSGIPITLRPTKQEILKEVNIMDQASKTLALPSGEERKGQLIPALPHANQTFLGTVISKKGTVSGSLALTHASLNGGLQKLLGSVFWKIATILGSFALLIAGLWKAARIGLRYFHKQETKEKRLPSVKKKKGRKAAKCKEEEASRNVKGNDVKMEQAPDEKSSQGLRHGDAGESLQSKTSNNAINKSPVSEVNDSSVNGNRGKAYLDHGEGCSVGSLFVTNTIIGYGSHGTVVLEGYLNKRHVAVKRLLGQFYEKAEKEIANLIVSDAHPNVVRCYAMESDTHFVYVALERCSFSLNDLVLVQSCQASGTPKNSTNAVHLTELDLEQLRLKVGDGKDLTLWDEWDRPSPKLLQFMRNIVDGLAHLHELGIVHRDLKPQNVLITSGCISCAKISDMGISKRLANDASSLDTNATGLGSSGWQAPEQLLHERQTRAVDLFSLGCVLFFVISGGHHPFGPHFERDRNILNGQPDLFPVEHIPEAIHLLSGLLDVDPSKRPTVTDVLVHPLFWSSEKRLSFLRDASDKVELEDRENQSPLLNDLEAAASVALGGSWDEKLDDVFLENLGRYRRYNYGSVRDLLRVIRNKSNHYRELPQDVQQLVGPIPEGYENYFRNKFPWLLLEVFKVMHDHCEGEDLFRTYFSTTTRSV